MAQVVSRRPLTAEARVRAPVNPCGICGGQVFLRVIRFSRQYHSTVALHTHISSVGRTVCPLVAAVQRRSFTQRNLQSAMV
jgi:hypothetical protein